MDNFSDETQRLLRRSPPNSDESFLGYIVRLTEINKCETPLWILQRLGINSSIILQGRSFVFSDKADVTPLCVLTNSDPSEWTQLLCPPVKSPNAFSQIMFGLSVPKRMIRIDHPKICPECLLDFNYHRKIWDLAPVTACPIHRCLLLEECPSCTNRISWTRKNVSICRCGFDWREASSVEIVDSELIFVREIYRRCGINIGQSEAKISENNPLFHLNLEDMLIAVVCIGNQYAGINDTKGKYNAESRKSKDFHPFIVKGFQAFENWPHNYYKFLDWKRRQKESTELSTNLSKDFRGFLLILKRSLESSSFDFMKIAFEEYLKSRWDGGLLTKKMLRFTKDSYDDRRFLSQEGVVKTLRVASDAVKGLVKAGLLKPIPYTRGENKDFLFDRNEVEELTQQIEQMATAKEIARLLGIGRVQVKDLVRKKCIKSFDIFAEIRFKNWRFNLNEAKQLLSTINSKVIEVSLSPKSDLIGFNESVTRLCPSGADMGDFIKAILNGEISPAGKTKKKGLSQFLYSLADIRKFAKGYRQKLKETFITVPEAAKIIGVKPEAVYFFLSKRLLLLQENCNKSLGLIINREEIDRFNSIYILAIKVARELGTSTTLLYNCLKDVGINPVSGLKIDGGKQYLYKKADLEGLYLADLVLKAKLRRDPRGQRHITISSEQACGALGIDKVKLMEIVRCGPLKPFMQLPCKEQSSYLFLRTDVEKFRDEQTDFSTLVTSLEAAYMLGETYGSFCGKWVITKRLTPIKFKHIPNKHYFFRKEVEELVTFKRETIRSIEAAAILRVNKVTIFKWTVSGKLKPIAGPNINGFGCNLYLRRDIERLRGELKQRRTREISIHAQ